MEQQTPIYISSSQNQTIKNLVKLREKRARQKTRTFLVEGLREIERALACEFLLKDLFICKDVAKRISPSELEQISQSAKKVYEFSEECFKKVAMRDGSDGLVGVFEQKDHELESLKFKNIPILVAIENLEKPGNLGAILRTVDGVGADAVILLENSVDLYNPNVIRSSLGTIFSVPVVTSSNKEFSSYLKSHNITSYSAALSQRSQSYLTKSFSEPTAFIMGNEAEGLSDFWFESSDHLIIIPMNGIADSLNVSVASSVLLYECYRQRFNPA